MPLPLSAALLLALCASGCAAPELPVPTTPAPALSLDQLQFTDAEAGARYRAVRAGLAGRVAGWRHVPLDRVGNYVEERWCGPAVSEAACRGGGVAMEEARGTAWATLSTFGYPPRWPEVFGVGLSAGDIPTTGGWGVKVEVTLDGQALAGTRFEATFLRLDGDVVTDRLAMGAWSHTVHATRIELSGLDRSDAGTLAELRALGASPAGFRAHATGRLEALRREVHAALGAGSVRRAVDGPYLGGGVPPERRLEPLTPAETALAAAEVDATFARWTAALDAHGDELHARLSGALGAGW